MTDSVTLEDQCHQKKVFVGGLGNMTNTQTLRDYFRRYGNIADAVVLRWPDGRSRGFGYVTFAGAAAATAVLKDAHKISGCDVDVKRAVPGTNKLFVGGLPQNTTAAELRTYFEQFGVVSDAVVMMDPATSRSRGFGFICFSPGPDGAAAISAALEKYDCHSIRGKWIEVKSAAPPRKLQAEEGQGVPSAPSDVRLDKEAKPAQADAPTANAMQGNFSSGPPSTAAEDLLPPPGLDMPAEQAAAWPQLDWTSSLQGRYPLPSLLAAGSRGFPGKSAHPVKLGSAEARKQPPLASPERSCAPERKQPPADPGTSDTALAGAFDGDEASGVFDASMELRRSLEQLLRLQSEQSIATSAR